MWLSISSAQVSFLACCCLTTSLSPKHCLFLTSWCTQWQ
jgi:hypothetical protein